MISYQFLLLHSSEIPEFSPEEKFTHLVNQDNEVWSDNNLFGSQPYLIIEEKDETGAMNRKITVKSSSSEEGFPLIPDVREIMSSVLHLLRSGAFDSFSELKDQQGLYLTMMTLETDEATDRKKWITVIEQFLLELNGVLVHPEVMRLPDFRSFFSLQRDIVEVEKEPE